jgi:hypothetical protein
VPKTSICQQTLSAEDVEAFSYAISRHYWYELFIDDLPIWGFVGDVRVAKSPKGGLSQGAGGGGEEQLLLYTHKQLDISFNGDRVRRVGEGLCVVCGAAHTRCGASAPAPVAHAAALPVCVRVTPQPRVQIIHVNLTSTDLVPVKEGQAVNFTVTVNWLPTLTPFSQRFERYLDYNFFEHKVWRLSVECVSAGCGVCVGCRVAQPTACACGVVIFSAHEPSHHTLLNARPSCHHRHMHTRMHMHMHMRTTDPLVLHLQLFPDGHVPHGPGGHHPHAHTAQGLRAVSARSRRGPVAAPHSRRVSHALGSRRG